jgi:RecA-family ATPase
MKHEVRVEDDLAVATKAARPIIMGADELLAKRLESPSMLIEGLFAKHGANLVCGAQKSNKTLIMAQAAIAISTGEPLFEYYSVTDPGPVMFIEQDDPGGDASIQDVLKRSPIPTKGIRFFTALRIPFPLGSEFIEWLEREIKSKGLRFVVLDSYTALRPARSGGTDLVKVEREELTLLDDLAKRARCSFGLIHHESQGSKKNTHWSDRAGSTFAMTAATEMMIHICRFPELEGNAPERLVRTRGRHDPGVEFVLRFRKETLDHEHVLEGGAAEYYPLLRQLKNTFGGRTFGPKEFYQETGTSRATAHRQIDRLCSAGALRKVGTGEYLLAR